MKENTSNELLKYIKTENVFEDACNIIETAQKVAYSGDFPPGKWKI